MEGEGDPRELKKGTGGLTGAQEAPSRKGPTVVATRGWDSRGKSQLRQLQDLGSERRLEAVFLNRALPEVDVLS